MGKGMQNVGRVWLVVDGFRFRTSDDKIPTSRKGSEKWGQPAHLIYSASPERMRIP
jgi:hypothetical protein